MFLTKFKYFLYETSFIRLRQGHKTDLWYDLSKILGFYKIFRMT